MSGNQGGMSCPAGCWMAAAGAGLLTFILSLTVGHKGFFAAIFLGALVFILLGLLLNWLFCKSGAGAAATTAGVAGAGAGAAVASSSEDATVSGQMGAAEPAALPASSGDGAAAMSGAGSDMDDAASDVETEPATAADASDGDASGDDASGDDASGDDAGAGAETQPEADAEPLVKPSTPLAGEAEIASRKGTWTYHDDGETSAEETAPAAPAEASPAAAVAAAAPTDGGARDYDKDGVLEGTGEGAKPEMMDAPREGGADNLKEIKGIGPKLEMLCHSLGVYHFDQIAGWGAQEVAWMDANLKGFRGRVSRDDWVGQAKILAAGGETEFSQRVDGGKVY